MHRPTGRCLRSKHMESWTFLNTTRHFCKKNYFHTRMAQCLCNTNKAVTDRRLRPRCCHLDSYFKHTSFSCRYIRRDIMCKHDVIKIFNTRRLYILCWRKYSRRKLSPTLAKPTTLVLTTLVAQCELSRR